MFTRLSVWAAVAATLAAIMQPASGAVRMAAMLAVCAAALVAALQAGRMRRPVWVSVFVAIAVVFNPIVGLEPTTVVALILTVGSLAVLVSWLAVLDHLEPKRSARQVG
jgi:hypothetical protein